MLPRGLDADRVAPRLWIGSAPCELAARDYGSLKHFSAVVLCAQEIQSLELPNVHIVKAPMDDAKPTQREIRTAVSAARTVHVLRKRGARVLVTCAQGVNRSALVTALALMIDGHSSDLAIRRIRAHREPPIGMVPLSNPHFVDLLHSFDRKRQRRRA